MSNPVVDVIVPVYRPDDKFYKLLQQLKQQTWPVHRIILMNTEKKFWDEFWKTREELNMENLEVHHISKAEFDHGGTRNQGVSYSEADVIVLMTDDAVPEDDHLIANLVKGFQRKGPNGEMVSSVYARQLPVQDCRIVERYTRSFNYPEESRVKTKADLAALGIKTYFCSNVCCAYDRKIFEKQGGFIRHTIFNEDMIYAAKAVEAGYSVAYAADAQVVHSHNYTNGQQFHRNFDLGVSQAEHPEIFAAYPSESEGKRMVKDVTVYLRSNHMSAGLPHFYMQCACKYAGYLLGKNYRRLPKKWVLAFTSNKEYWKQNRKDV